MFVSYKPLCRTMLECRSCFPSETPPHQSKTTLVEQKQYLEKNRLLQQVNEFLAVSKECRSHDWNTTRHVMEDKGENSAGQSTEEMLKLFSAFLLLCTPDGWRPVVTFLFTIYVKIHIESTCMYGWTLYHWLFDNTFHLHFFKSISKWKY